MHTEEKYMQRAIELAKKGQGMVNPNPLVGAVIVKDGRIIGEGYHEKYGQLHAERNALKNCTENPKGAALYVTLEPCCHYGKDPSLHRSHYREWNFLRRHRFSRSQSPGQRRRSRSSAPRRNPGHRRLYEDRLRPAQSNFFPLHYPQNALCGYEIRHDHRWEDCHRSRLFPLHYRKRSAAASSSGSKPSNGHHGWESAPSSSMIRC